MQLFHVPPFITSLKPSIATIGNFDGLHLGHQALLQQLKILAKEKQLASTVILFEPQPQEFFQQDQAPARLQKISEKLAGLKTLGIDQVFCLRFDQTLANTSAEGFVRLLESWKIQALCVGEDFHFGKHREGDVAFLKTHAKMEIHLAPSYCMDERRVSSTAIREALQKGAFETAAKLLGRPYTISGKVMHGNKVGRLMAFPTANLRVDRKVSPLWGIYAVRVFLPSGESFPGVANIGKRPTLTEGREWFLESFLFTDTDPHLYGQRMVVECVKKIRDEQKFDSFEALKAQIQKDVDIAKAYFGMG